MRHLTRLLNTLIETCWDASEGYEAAAIHVRDLRLKQLLRRLALERTAFAEELRQEVERLGGSPHVRGTVRGALHRGWIVMAGAGGATADDVLRQCTFGERASLDHYETALRTDLPADLRGLLKQHHHRMQQVAELLAELRQVAR